jgi:hypothetical protein
MISLLVLVVIVVIAMFVFTNRLGSTGVCEYPGSVGVGVMVIEFSKIDKICYVVSLLSVLTGVATGVLLVWGPKGSDLVWKLFGTSVILFLGSILTLQLNRLMRGPRKPNTEAQSTRKD